MCIRDRSGSDRNKSTNIINRGQPIHRPIHHIYKDKTFKEIIEYHTENDIKPISNFMCRFISPIKPTFEGAVEQINKKYLTIVPLSELNDFINTLSVIFEGDTVFGSSTQNKGFEYKLKPTKEDLITLKELNKEDIKLFEYIQKNYNGSEGYLRNRLQELSVK